MNDNNINRKSAARQDNMSNYELSRAYAKEGLYKTTTRYGEISQGATPHTWMDASGQVGRSAMAGAKDFGQSAKHAGMGFMEGVSKQNPNSGQQLNNMKINQQIAKDSANARQSIQNHNYNPKAQKMTQQTPAKQSGKNDKQANNSTTNKGIASFQNKQSANTSKSSVTNRGISSFQSRSNGQSATSSNISASGSTKGASSSSGSSSGSSKGR
jgi:hypothetical protein